MATKNAKCTITLELYNDVAGYNTCPTVSAGGWWASWVFNRIENNLYNINRYVYSLEIGTKKTFYNNQQFIDYAELNRINADVYRWTGYFTRYLGWMMMFPDEVRDND